MTTALEKSRAQEINQLHLEIKGHWKMTVDKAARIGQLLEQQKKALEHGQFIPWIESSLDFSKRTAQNYKNVYKNRGALKSANVALLADAYTQSAKRTKPLFRRRRAHIGFKVKIFKRELIFSLRVK